MLAVNMWTFLFEILSLLRSCIRHDMAFATSGTRMLYRAITRSCNVGLQRIASFCSRIELSGCWWSKCKQSALSVGRPRKRGRNN